MEAPPRWTSPMRCMPWSTKEAASARARRPRAAVAERIVRDTVGLGPLEDLLADPAVEEVMVNGPDDVYVERAGGSRPTDVRFRRRGGAAQHDRAHPRAAGTADRRAQPDGRRPPRRRLARQRRDPAAGDRRAGALDPALRRRSARPAGAGRARDASALLSASCSSRRSRSGAASSSAAVPAPARRPCSTRSRASSTPASGS